MGPFTPIFIASKLSGHSDHYHKWNRRAISLCSELGGKQASKRYLWFDRAKDSLCFGIFKLSILISETINTWFFMIHLLFLPIYVQAMTVQNQNCSGFYRSEDFKENKNYHTNFRQHSCINKHHIKSEFITFRMRAEMKRKCVELKCKGEIWTMITTSIWS